MCATLAVRWSFHLKSSRRSRNLEGVDLSDQRPARDSQHNFIRRFKRAAVTNQPPARYAGKFHQQPGRWNAGILACGSPASLPAIPAALSPAVLLTNRERTARLAHGLGART